MPDVHLPMVSMGTTTKRVTIDPITRIEGHLRIEVDVRDGSVVDAWSSGTMFRGLELVLRGRDPRDAWLFAQRICGVCTTVHALCSVRAVEDALGIAIPDNARLIRNLIEAAQFVQDHVIHFYHLHGPDWVDVVDAVSADPAAASTLARSVSDWPNSDPTYFAEVKQRLETFVAGGQLGLFGNGYWGHSEYRLPPEGNLLAVAHYLEALGWQREMIRIHALLGGKTPHPQTYLVGGMALPVDPTGGHGVNPGTIAQLRHLVSRARDFVSRVYVPDLLLVGSFYKEWASLGAGPGNFLSYGDFPERREGDPGLLWLPGGIVLANDIGTVPQPVDHSLIREYIARSWYKYAGGDGVGLHPSVGETDAQYSGPEPPYDFMDTSAKYSWLKAPRYDEKPMEVGPLARMVVAYAAGHSGVRGAINGALAHLDLEPEALFSTLGRIVARGLETALIADQMSRWVDELEANMNGGNLAVHNGARWDPASWPGEAEGWGSTEAPRGGLAHWVRIENGVIANYQAVVPTTWNGSPRDAQNRRGVWEEALIGTPVADPAQPLEILRTVHSFDPCMACAVHVADASDRGGARVSVR